MDIRLRMNMDGTRRELGRSSGFERRCTRISSDADKQAAREPTESLRNIPAEGMILRTAMTPMSSLFVILPPYTPLL